MAGKSSKKKAPVKPRRRWGLWIFLFFAVLLTGFLGWMHLTARTVHVRYAEVRLADLPQAFDGTRILYASDIDLCGVNTPRQAAKLFRRLQQLRPDMLLLGGDYASPNLIERLNGGSGADKRSVRSAFFDSLSTFQAPLGKFAISGENDGDADALRIAMTHSGVKLIDGGLEVVSKDGAAIAVAGIGSTPCDANALAGNFLAGQCVVAMIHSPEQIVDVRISEARDGGAWADLILAGHTHGGQLQIAGEPEKRYLAGWFTDTGAPMLVSQGVGCEGANFRLGTQAEVWLITLRSGAAQP